jgi:phosphatidate phosphatase PAH1
MGNARWATSIALVTAMAVVAVAGCGSGGDDASADDTVEPTVDERTTAVAAGDDVQPCAEDRHGVVIDMDGTLTASIDELALWVANPAYDPAVRAGAVDLMQAWRTLGYEIVYLTGRPADMRIGRTPIADATAAWLERHRFPTGEGTQLFVWDASAVERLEQFKAQTLIDLQREGLSLDYGYTDATLDVVAYRTAGIDADHIFTIGEASGFQEGTVAVPDPSWLPHQVAVVDELPPVCAV